MGEEEIGRRFSQIFMDSFANSASLRWITMITIDDFESNPSNYVWVQNGTMVIDSRFDEFFLGNKELLLACLEDNMTDDEIDYNEAIADYKKSLWWIATESHEKSRKLIPCSSVLICG